jgi:toxin YoeB
MEKEIVWTTTAKKQLFEILDYWRNRTKTLRYGEELLDGLDYTFSILQHSPKIGRKTNIEGVYLKPFKRNFLIVYQFNEKEIVILNFWDVRQNPKRNSYLK